jgi:xylobiose transport system substrate-binding protein
VIVVAAATALAMTTAGCGTSGTSASSNSSKETLQVWDLQDALDPAQVADVAQFNKTSAVKVVLTEVSSNGYPDKVRTAMGSNKAPDVFFNWGGGSIRDYVNANMLLPLTSAVAASPALSTSFIPSVLNAGKVNGVQYGIPLRGMQPVMMFYNKAVFAANGLKVPTTWAQLQSLIPAFKAKGITPFAVAGAATSAWTEQMWLEYLVDRIGGPQVFSKIEAGDMSAWSNPAVLKAATMVKQLIAEGAFGTNFGSVNYGSGGTSTLVSEGKAAMQLMGSWEYSTQLADSPGFAKTGLGWFAFPSIPAGVGNSADVVGNPTNYVSVNAKTQNKATAIAFLKSLSSADYTADLVKQGEVPTTLSAPSYLSAAPVPAFAKFQYNLVSAAPSFQLSWDEALSPAESTPMITDENELFSGQLTPQAFVSALSALK